MFHIYSKIPTRASLDDKLCLKNRVFLLDTVWSSLENTALNGRRASLDSVSCWEHAATAGMEDVQVH